MSTDRFFFHSKSAPARPGKGTNESLGSGQQYTTLVNNPHWRRALSNFWVAPFDLDGHRWNTVEHYFQAQKLRIHSDARGELFERTWPFAMFCLDCTMENAIEIVPQVQEYPHMFTTMAHGVATGDGALARKHRKWQTLSPEHLALWDIRKERAMARAQFAKFSQNPTMREILLATGTAELWHGAARQPAARMRCLERVRAALAAGQTALSPADDDSEDEL